MLALIRQETSEWSVGELSAVDFLRLQKNILGTQNLLRSAWLLAVAWTSCLGAPVGGAARCEGGPAASPLAALMKSHRAAAD